ncbi:MAG: M20/M25/M40 family metallo-hydrolase [Gemmatimonadota bacterium]|nr:MAG: M20/M25/M40 family metallo-hydrolase [Gemmatimonadota bacterium]
MAERLRGSGYEVELVGFAAAPRRVMASVVAGAGLGWAALALSPFLVIALPGWPVALMGVGALGLVALVTHGVARGQLPISPADVEATNLVARRGSPALWLVAHLDSKSQRISLRGRVIAAVCAVVGLGLLLVMLALRLSEPVPPWTVLALVTPALVGGGMLSLGAPGNRSPGAVDNATGIVAALVAAELLGSRDDVGVLLTGAEEFGMEGARDWVARCEPVGAFINFDGLDSRGAYRIQVHPTAPGGGKSPVPSAGMAQAVAAALEEEGDDVVVRPLPLGTFVDGAVLAGAGMPGVTISRGDWETLGVVHTPRDEPGRVDVAAAVRAGQAAARVAEQLLG